MVENTAYALISFYSPPDPVIASQSYENFLVVAYLGPSSFEVVPVKLIISCVAVIPMGVFIPEDPRHFVCERIGETVAVLGGAEEFDDQDRDVDPDED